MKLYKYLVIISVAIFSLIGFSGCEKKYYEVGADTISYDFIVSKTGNRDIWTWSEARRRYECEFSFSELAENVFYDGAVLGYIYVQEGDLLTQKILPYVETYQDGNTTYTETYGFDISLNPKTILFYMQASNLGNYDQYINTTKFKVTLIRKN
jgi:hypothetical protein